MPHIFMNYLLMCTKYNAVSCCHCFCFFSAVHMSCPELGLGTFTYLAVTNLQSCIDISVAQLLISVDHCVRTLSENWPLLLASVSDSVVKWLLTLYSLKCLIGTLLDGYWHLGSNIASIVSSLRSQEDTRPYFSSFCSAWNNSGKGLL